MKNTGLKIIVVDNNSGRSAILRRALQDKGHEVILRLNDCQQLLETPEINHADTVIVNTDIPDDLVFANLTDVNLAKPKPIVMFAEQSNTQMASDAIKAGVNAFIVDGLEHERVQPIIDVAIARFREFQALKDELDYTKNQLQDRKDIEKAKGLLMEHKSINEDEAFQALRKMAMDQNARMGDVARNVIQVMSIL